VRSGFKRCFPCWKREKCGGVPMLYVTHDRAEADRLGTTLVRI